MCVCKPKKKRKKKYLAAAAAFLFLMQTALAFGADPVIAPESNPLAPVMEPGTATEPAGTFTLEPEPETSGDFLSTSPLSEPTLQEEPAEVSALWVTEWIKAPSNPRYSFRKVSTGIYTYLHIRDNETGTLLHFLTVRSNEKITALDVDPTGKFALANVTGSHLAKGGYLAMYDIRQKLRARPVDALTGIASSFLSGVVTDNCGCTSKTPYRFVNGLILANLKDTSISNGATSGYILNHTTSTLRYTKTVPIGFMDKYLVTPQRDRMIFMALGPDYIHSWVAIYNYSTGRITFPAQPSNGFGGIKGLTSDGNFAVVATHQNVIYAVSVRNRSIPDRSVTVSVPAGESIFNYKLKSISFYSQNVIEGTLANGKKVWLYLDSVAFRILQPAKEVQAAHHPDYVFVTVNTGAGQEFYLRNKRLGRSYLLKTIGFGEEVHSVDVDPTGRYAFFNVIGSQHAQYGYTQIYDVNAGAFVSFVDPATGMMVERVHGVLYDEDAMHTPSAFQFVNGIVLMSYHSGGYNTPIGGYIFNLKQSIVRLTRTGYILTNEPILATPQGDKVVFATYAPNYSGQIGIYDVNTTRVDLQPSDGLKLRSISPDGKYAVAASDDNKLYAVSIRNLSIATRVVTIPYDCTGIGGYECWQKRYQYAVVSARFISGNTIEAVLKNGQVVRFYLDDFSFRLL